MPDTVAARRPRMPLRPAAGTYALVLRSDTDCEVTYGRGRKLDVVAGTYAYVGSAFGPGGVRARVSRHARARKAAHWHIDYLTQRFPACASIVCYEPVRHEHEWAGLLGGERAITAVPGFGCTDCRCRSHLFFGEHESVVIEALARLPGATTWWRP